MATNNPTAPSVATLKRLFALSGNQCAFPSCRASLVDGEKVVGKVCHIKAQRPRGPRYDPNQTAVERHGFSNLVGMCGRHADVIDADAQAYSVERLQQMKADHEKNASTMSDADAEYGSQLLFVNQSVYSANQSGGITAHTVHVHNYDGSSSMRDVQQPAFVTPKDGSARFRQSGDPLGSLWDPMPHARSDGREIYLAQGPAIWLRLMPKTIPSHEWVHDELTRCARRPDVVLQPLAWINLQYIRAEDGIGAFSTVDLRARETETPSVAFAFVTGEVWCTDTSVLGKGKYLHFLDIARTLLHRFRGYSEYLQCLGLQSPFRWIAGVEGVKGWTLTSPSPPNRVNISPGETCLSDVISAEGNFDLEQPAAMTLMPFFRQMYKKCGMNIPQHIEELLRTNRGF